MKEHQLTPRARVRGDEVTYPGEAQSSDPDKEEP